MLLRMLIVLLIRDQVAETLQLDPDALESGTGRACGKSEFGKTFKLAFPSQSYLGLEAVGTRLYVLVASWHSQAMTSLMRLQIRFSDLDPESTRRVLDDISKRTVLAK